MTVLNWDWQRGVRLNLQKNNSRAQKSLSAAACGDFYNNILHGVLNIKSPL
jgi:hypothetical protein